MSINKNIVDYIEDFDGFDFLENFRFGGHSIKHKQNHRQSIKRNLNLHNNSYALLKDKQLSNHFLRNVKKKAPSAYLRKPVIKSQFAGGKYVNRSIRGKSYRIPLKYKTNMKKRIENAENERKELDFIVERKNMENRPKELRKYKTNQEHVKKTYNSRRHIDRNFPAFLDLKTKERYAFKKRFKRNLENTENRTANPNKHSKKLDGLVTNRRPFRDDNRDEDIEDDNEDNNEDNEDEEDIVLEEDAAYHVTTEQSLEKDEMEQEQVDNYRNDTLNRALKNEFKEDKSESVPSCNCRKCFYLPFLMYIFFIQIHVMLM